ncbi:WD40 repeat domain-containing protein [Dactylosporangium sp. NPDC051541]|uniref:WD40 repeat domain-containing protein n=1 Tax=Dactylosporangium sp. NPDC051541 TaxID=3363977 RepID=UPI0037B3E633
MNDDRHARMQRDVSLALIAAASRETAELNPYLVRNLSGHVADGNAWRSLAAVPTLLDQLDPAAVTVDALRSIFTSDAIPPEIAGIIAAHHRLRTGRAADAAGVRQFATALTQGFLLGEDRPSPRTPWVIRWAVTSSQPLHVTLPAHEGFVNEICVVADADRVLLASGGDDFLVRVWDPFTAEPHGEPMRAHTDTVEAVCAFRLPSGRTGVASGGSDGRVCAWDISTGRLLVPPMLGHVGTVRAVAAVDQPVGGSWIVSAGYDGTIRVWDMAAGGAPTAVLAGHDGPVVALAPSQIHREPATFYSASVDGTVRRWVIGQADGQVLVRRTSGLRSLCVAQAAEEAEVIAFAGYEGHIECVLSNRPGDVEAVLSGHRGAVWGLSAWGAGPDIRVLSAGDDATVRQWRPRSPNPARPALSGHIGTVVSACVVARPSGAYLIASGGSDGTIRLWSPSGRPRRAAGLRSPDPLRDVCVMRSSGGPETLVAVAMSGFVFFWNLRTAQLRRSPLPLGEAPIWCACPLDNGPHRLAVGTSEGRILLLDESGAVTGRIDAHAGPVRDLAVAAVSGDSAVLASVGDDRRLRLWDIEQVASFGDPPLAHSGAGTISGVTAVRAGTVDWLATSADDGSIQLWDPASRAPVGPAMTGHVGPVLCLAAISGTATRSGYVVSAGVDATVRIWHPERHQHCLTVVSGHAGGIRDVAVVAEHQDTAEVATVGADGRIKLHRVTYTSETQWRLIGTETVHEGSDGGLRAVVPMRSAAGEEFAVVGEAGAVSLWSVRERRPVREPLIASSAVQFDVAPFTSDGVPYCAAIGGDGELRLWRLDAADVLGAASPGGHGAFTAVAAGPDSGGVLLAAGGSDGSLHWFGAGLDARGEVNAGAAVVDVCWLEAQKVAIALEDGAVQIWDVVGREPVARIAGRAARSVFALRDAGPMELTGYVSANEVGLLRSATGAVVATWDVFDGRRPNAAVAIPGSGDRPLRVVVVGMDGLAMIWEPQSGTARTMEAPAQHLQAVAWLTLDGREVMAAGGAGGELLLWDLTPGLPLPAIPLDVPILSVTDASTPDAARLLIGTTRGLVCVELGGSLGR